MYKVTIKHQDGRQLDFVLEGLSTIGRDKACEITLDSSMVSRRHATLDETADGVFITDLGSTNGSFIGQTQLAKQTPTYLDGLQPLSIGEFTIEVEFEDEDDVATIMCIEESTPPEELYQRSHLISRHEELCVWDGKETDMQITAVLAESHDVNTFRMVAPEPVLFNYMPGQFIGVSVEIEGKTVRRSYSISSSPARPHVLEITVKRNPGGVVSNWLPDNLKVGDTLRVRGPMGKFSCFMHPSPKMLLLAAGVGITPLMSMLRWVVDSGAETDVVLLYSIRSPADMVYKRELECIIALQPNIKVIAAATDTAQGHAWTGLSQRLNGAAIAFNVPDFKEREVFLCGPKPFADAMIKQLEEAGLPMAQFHQESFGGAPPKGKPKAAAPAPESAPRVPAQAAAPAPAPPVAPTPPPAPAPAPPVAAPAAPAPAAAPAPVAAVPAAGGIQITFTQSQVSFPAEADLSLLEMAEENDLELAYGCREGKCGACKVKCTSGTVTMPDNDMSEAERAEGWIYTCVAEPTSSLEIEA